MKLFQNRIVGVEHLTMLDYPNKLAAILFYRGCNLKCPYCYNVDVVNGSLTDQCSEDIIEFANKRKGKLDAFVFSGGECTIHGEKLIEDVRYIKSLGYLTKIDTNGTNPEVLERLINENLINYTALDFKALGDKIGLFFNEPKTYIEKWSKTFDILKKSNIDWEVRTTVHSDILSEDDLSAMCEFLVKNGYTNTYYIQNFFKNAPRYLYPDLNRDPKTIDVSKIKMRGLKVEYRNFDSY